MADDKVACHDAWGSAKAVTVNRVKATVNKNRKRRRVMNMVRTVSVKDQTQREGMADKQIGIAPIS
jgi:hypothetical protein